MSRADDKWPAARLASLPGGGMRKHLWLAILLLGTHPAIAQTDLEAPSAANQCGRTHRAMLPIIAGTHRVADYPLIARRLEQQGRTWMRVLVDKNGIAREAIVIYTSGTKRLDEAAVDSIVGKWRWQPPPPECAESGVMLLVMQDFHIGEPGQFRDPDVLLVYLDSPLYPHDAREQKTGGTGDAIMRVSNTGETSEVQIAVSAQSAEMDAAMIEISKQMRVLPEPGKEPAERLERVTFRFIPHNNPETIAGLMGPAESAP